MASGVIVTGGSEGGGARLVVTGGDEGADVGVVGVSVTGVFLDGASPLPPRVAYTPSAAAVTASTPTAEARIGTVRDFRWGRAVVASTFRSCVGASESTARRLADVAAARVGADAG